MSNSTSKNSSMPKQGAMMFPVLRIMLNLSKKDSEDFIPNDDIFSELIKEMYISPAALSKRYNDSKVKIVHNRFEFALKDLRKAELIDRSEEHTSELQSQR